MIKESLAGASITYLNEWNATSRALQLEFHSCDWDGARGAIIQEFEQLITKAMNMQLAKNYHELVFSYDGFLIIFDCGSRGQLTEDHRYATLRIKSISHVKKFDTYLAAVIYTCKMISSTRTSTCSIWRIPKMTDSC